MELQMLNNTNSNTTAVKTQAISMVWMVDYSTGNLVNEARTMEYLPKEGEPQGGLWLN
jgi:hypothetical protein